MGQGLRELLVLIITNLGGLYILAVLLRFLLQATRADFYNPVSQTIVKVTNPALRPFRKIIPGYRGLDFAALVLALILNSIATAVMRAIAGYPFDFGVTVSWSFLGLLAFFVNVYFYSILISAIASFVAPFSSNPILLVIYQILDPLYSRVRRVIPPIGMLDLSPMFILLALTALEYVFIYPLAQGLGVQPVLVIGI